ncbi:MAG TPA: 16S rRNA (guanine(966)-N(2))-methyltransferase RsmD [Nocardioidaceae bacterium]|nr:16S rRNA (guanine(966)-N(2))-methyltransferase RsmD [Nocardioidaceae bacterium]
MTRIIAGTAGGRRLKTPRGTSTRPTSDRVREALFSAVDSALGSVAGLRFLDLYAGSGAVGLEARSRGAGLVTLVEQDRRTAALIKENAATLGFQGVEVEASPVDRSLARLPRAPYDIVFLDPPYALPGAEVEEVLALLVGNGWLIADALVVVERSARDAGPQWPSGCVADRSRRYGETTLWYGHAAGPGQRT